MPQSATEKRKSKQFPFSSAHVPLYTSSLTAVLFVGLVGAVRDAITLWIDLADTGGGATLEVSTAV